MSFCATDTRKDKFVPSEKQVETRVLFDFHLLSSHTESNNGSNEKQFRPKQLDILQQPSIKLGMQMSFREGAHPATSNDVHR